MVLGLSLRVSWICLLLLSSGACFPATKGDYRYPYTATLGSVGGPAPGSNLQSEGSRPPLVSLQYEAAPQQPSSPSGNQSPSSVGTPNMAAGSSPSYAPNRFIVTYDPSSNKPSSAPAVPSQNAGYVSPPVGPAGTGKKTPSFSVQPQPVGTSGNSNMGSNVAAFSPVYEASPFPPSGSAYPAGNMATTYDSGYRPARYSAAPATYNSGYRPARYSAAPATYNSGYRPARYAASPATYDSGYGSARYAAAPTYDAGAGPARYAAAPATQGFGDGPVPYGNPSNPGLPWDGQPAGGAFGSFSDPSNWMPSRSFPDFSAWDSNNEMPQSVSETSPLPPSSYIIQSSNGYQRAREVLSHTKYSPEYPEPPVFPYRAVNAPSKSPPATGSKGGTKV